SPTLRWVGGEIALILNRHTDPPSLTDQVLLARHINKTTGGEYMSNSCRFILQIFSVFLLASAFVFGQTTTGSIEGTIKDTKGAVVPGATVTAIGQTAGFKQTTTSNSDGVYRFERVPPGKYVITVGAISG